MSVSLEDTKVELQLNGLFNEQDWIQRANWEEGTDTDADALSPDWDFEADFEEGDVTDFGGASGGSPIASQAAAKIGTWGVEIDCSGTTSEFLRDDTPADETVWVAETWFNTNAISMNSGSEHRIFYGVDTVNSVHAPRVALNYDGTNLRIRAGDLSDGSVISWTSYQNIADGWHHIRIYWEASSGAGNNDGRLVLYDNGARLEELSGLDNDTRSVGTFICGYVNGDAGTSGTVYYDQVQWSNGPGSPVWITEGVALEGSFGAALTIEDTTNRYVALTDPSAETKGTWYSTVDINSLTMSSDNEYVTGAAIQDTDSTHAFRINTKRTGGAYVLYTQAQLDDGTFTNGAEVALADKPKEVRAAWGASSGAGNDDGFLHLWVGQTLVDSLTGLDNDTVVFDEMRWGPLSGLDSGTSGVYFMDNCWWSRAAHHWTDVTDDVLRSEQVRIKYGMASPRPTERVATGGSARFSLDNSGETNSGGVDGYYVPNHQNVRSGFDQGVGVRIGYQYDSDTYWKFRGKIREIRPLPGKYGDGRSDIVCEDWMAEMLRRKPQQISLQTSQRADQLLSTLLQNVTVQPSDTDLGTGASTFTNAFDEMDDGFTTAHQVLKNIALSEYGYIYLRGDTDTGGVLTFEDRNTRTNDTTTGTLLDDDADTDDMLDIKLSDNQNLIFNTITGVAFPRTIDDTSSDQVLWSLVGDAPTITPGETQVYIGQYTDSDNPDARVGGADVVTPEAGVDFVFSGADTDLTVSATLGGNSARLEVTLDSDASSGTINTLQVRGKRVNVYQPVRAEAMDSDSVDDFGDRDLEMRFRYQEDALEVKDFIDITLEEHQQNRVRAESVTFRANKSDHLMKAALQGEPGTRATITETMSGLDAVPHYVHGVSLNLAQGTLLDATWALVTASAADYWQLNEDALDTDTRLGF